VLPDTLHDINGYDVTTQCSLDPDAPFTELLIGMTVINTDGGGWHGVMSATQFEEAIAFSS